MATGNFNPDSVKQKKLNQKAKEVWIDGPRGKKIMIVNSKGEFVRPNRLGTEQGDRGYKKWQGRINDAMLKSGLYPRLNRAAGMQDRWNKKQYNQTISDLKIINDQFSKIEASKGSENEYAMSLAIPGLTKRKAKLEARRLELEEQSIGTNWDLFNDPTSPSYKGGEEAGQIVGGSTNAVPLGIKGIEVDNTVTPSAQDGSTTGSAQVTGDTEGHVGNSEERQNSNQTVPNNAVDNNVNQLRTWRRGTGEKLRGAAGADARTEQWLTDRGVDITQISKYDKRQIYKNLRIRGPHITNGSIMLDTGGRGINSRFSLKINRDI